MPDNERPSKASTRKKRPNFQTYRYTFLGSDHEQVVAALELFIASDELAQKLASELLEKSAAAFVEVWAAGSLVLQVARVPKQPA